MPANEIRDFIFQNYYKIIGFSKENSYYSMKRLKKIIVACKEINIKIPVSHNAKEHYWSFMKKKNTKWVKQTKINTCQPKTFENPNIVDINQLLQNIKKLHINYPRL